MKEVLLKSRKQVRIYLNEANSEDLARLVEATELPETTICNALVSAGLVALRGHGYKINFPLRLKIEEKK